ncbi:MAG: MGMT family protein [Cyanobacteria bacterium J06621_8]
MPKSQARVIHLYRKQERKGAMSAADTLPIDRGWGIVEDLNSDRLSPRQILLTSIQELNQLSIPPGELRENIVLDVANFAGFQPGAKLTFSSGAAIRLTFYCEPCRRVAHLVSSLSTLNQKRGILGVAITSGEITLEDEVLIEPNYFTALSEKPYERFLSYIARIPQGKVVTYRQILRCIGVDRSYFRVIPTYIKKAPPNYPRHRILNSQAQTIPHVHEQSAQLAAEGVELCPDSSDSSRYRVDLAQYAWQDSLIND